MTDNAVTDGDLRNARLWAEKVGPPYTSPNYIGTPSEIYNVARVVLATVEAPPLSEDLAHVTEHWETWPTEAITDALTAATDLAKQMEHDLEEARAEVERLRATHPNAEGTRHGYDIRHAMREDQE